MILEELCGAYLVLDRLLNTTSSKASVAGKLAVVFVSRSPQE
jgi:hypothetical protein